MEEVLMGQGLATGMFYHAPAGTKLPDSPFATLPEAWKKVGDVTQDGITLTTDKKPKTLRTGLTRLSVQSSRITLRASEHPSWIPQRKP